MNPVRIAAFLLLSALTAAPSSGFAQAVPAATAAPNPAVAPVKEEAIQNLDARISKLQSTRDCIDAAKTKDAVQACRKDLKLQRQKSRRAKD